MSLLTSGNNRARPYVVLGKPCPHPDRVMPDFEPDDTRPNDRQPLLDLSLVVVAFQTGVDLVTQGLPPDTFAARWLAQVGVSRG